MIQVEGLPNMAKAKTYWWQGNSTERYWCEITGREDIGDDLNCPQSDEAGNAYWSYSIINLIQPGDIVFHYSTTQQAFVGASVAAGFVRDGTTEWTPHGTVGRRKVASNKVRPAWRLHLLEFTKSVNPLTLNAVQQDENWVRAWIAARKSEKSLYAPFQPYPGRLRACQGYLTKMPADFVQRWQALGELANNLDEENRASSADLEADAAMAVLAREVAGGPRGQGFLISSKLRKAIEQHAVDMARKHFVSAGYRVKVLGKPYDLICSAKEETLYVEVKGTTTDGLTVFLTPNEIAFAREHKAQMALFLVSGIEVSNA